VAIDTKTVLATIDKLLGVAQADRAASNPVARQMVFQGTLDVLTTLHGPNSPQLSDLLQMRERKWKTLGMTLGTDNSVSIEIDVFNAAAGTLWALRESVTGGLVTTIQSEVSREVFADMLALAQQAMEQDHKDVAAVLGSAALEDALKRFADANGIAVADKEMAEVVNALKSKGLMKADQGNLVGAYVKLRNKAMHAEWEKVDKPQVKSMLAFTESFILTALR
jgi:hypothetical protein